MKKLKHLYVYILECSDKSYYTGITNNPERRVEQHNEGINKSSYTYRRRPIKIIYCERFSDFKLAIKWEKRIKDWNRKKKEALINENWDLLRIEAACKNDTSHKNNVNRNETAHILDSARIDSTLSVSSSGVENKHEAE